jgi:hypothetical protein
MENEYPASGCARGEFIVSGGREEGEIEHVPNSTDLFGPGLAQTDMVAPVMRFDISNAAQTHTHTHTHSAGCGCF